MNHDNDFNDPDYPTAVAATAYAIHSLEDTTYVPDNMLSKRKTKVEDTWILPDWILPQPIRNVLDFSEGTSRNSFDYPDIKEPSRMRTSRRVSENRDKSFNKMKSRAENTGILPKPHETALNFSDENSKRTSKDPATEMPISPSTPKKEVGRRPSIKKKLSFVDDDDTTSNKPDKPAPERARSWRPSTPANKHFDISDSPMPEITRPRPDHVPSMAQPSETRWESSRKPGPEDSMADGWEKEEMASIKDKYERLKAVIDEWEIKKRKKAKNKLERVEANPNKSRAKAMERYREEIERIAEIAAGARAQAEENRRKEEFKVMEKANKIRITGKIPATCLCF